MRAKGRKGLEPAAQALRDAVADEEDGGAGASADPQIFPNDDNDTDLDEDELQEDVEEQEEDVGEEVGAGG